MRRRRDGCWQLPLVLEGWWREAAAEVCAMDRQTLRDSVYRYNELGLEGLFDQPAATAHGRVCKPSSRPKWRNGSSRARSLSETL
jgi:hypothetical protein